MRILSKSLLGLSIGTVFFASCSKEIVRPSDSDDYFPLRVGKYVLYDVDSTVYDNFSKTTYRNHYQMRYEVVDSFMDGQGRLSYAINVYERPESKDEFYARDVIHITKTASGVEWTQSNVKLLKLIFPVSNDATWDGLTYVNARDESMKEYDSSAYIWNFKLSNVGEHFDPGNNPFYKTAIVSGIDETTNEPDGESYADRNYYREIYATGVGMIHRERIYWTYQPGVGPGQGYRKGYEVVMRAVDQN